MSACNHEAWEENGSSRVCAEPGCRKSLAPVHRSPVIGTVTPAATLPADCEGELRANVLRMFSEGNTRDAERLEAIIDRYSGVRPMRTDARKP